MKRIQRIYIASEDQGWADLVTASLSLAFEESIITTTHSIEQLWNLEHSNLIVYDRRTMGNPSVNLISPLSRNGKWLLVNATQQDTECVQALISMGWYGLIQSDQTWEHLHRAIKCMVTNQLWFSRDEMSNSIQSIIHHHVKGSLPIETIGSRYELSAKEQKVFLLLIQGLSNKDIAIKQNVSISTVKTHVSNILSKTGTHSRTQLSALMIE